MPCPICEKRKPGRFCPAKGESICAVCCGEGREITIDCVPDCAHLLAAHRYEDEHPRHIPPDTPLLDERVPQDFMHTQGELLASLAHQVAKSTAAEPSARDSDVLTAIQSLAESYRTLTRGVYYERPPDGFVALQLYRSLAQFLNELKQELARRTGPPVRDLEIFHVLVVLYRYGLLHSNGRRLSRKFVELLHAQFPDSAEAKRQESRIIVP
jgi:hypothetical protein